MLLNATVLIKKKTAASYDENAINPDNSALYIMETGGCCEAVSRRAIILITRKYLILFWMISEVTIRTNIIRNPLKDA